LALRSLTSQLVVGLSHGHKIFSACGAAPVLGWPAAQKAESRAISKQIGDYPLLQGEAGDLVLSRWCIYFLLPAAYCLVHAACNKSARAGATAAGGRHGMRQQAAEMQR
jgi:hypothetical protein